MKQEVTEIQINGTTYVPKGSQPVVQPNGDIKIVILQRGWVMIGRLERGAFA